MNAQELREEMEILRASAREMRKIADSLDERADHLRRLSAELETGELDLGLNTQCKP